jgi:hypothetical protein
MKKLFVIVSVFLGNIALAQTSVIPNFPGEKITATETGINGTQISTSPWTGEIDVHLANHVVWTGRISQPSTLTEVQMTCQQSPDGIEWGPIPVCNDAAPPLLVCNTRQWTWLKSQGLKFTFYVPVNAYKLKCQFTGTTPGASLLKVVGLKAAL